MNAHTRRGLQIAGAVLLVLAMVGGIVGLFRGTFDGYLTPNAAQRKTCNDQRGKIGFFLEDDGDATCDTRTQRQHCDQPGQSIIGSLPIGGHPTDRVKCRIDILPSGQLDRD